jgi:hypothetical protein
MEVLQLAQARLLQMQMQMLDGQTRRLLMGPSTKVDMQEVAMGVAVGVAMTHMSNGLLLA